MVEKPKPEYAPSTLAIAGRYILTNKIFEHLEKVKPDAGGEIQLTDGIASQLKNDRMLARICPVLNVTGTHGSPPMTPP